MRICRLLVLFTAVILTTTAGASLTPGQWVMVKEDADLGEWVHALITDVTEDQILAEVDFNVAKVNLRGRKLRRLSPARQRFLTQESLRDAVNMEEQINKINKAGGRAEPSGYNRLYVRIREAPRTEFLDNGKFVDQPQRQNSIFNDPAYVNDLIKEVEAQGGILIHFARLPDWLVPIAFVHLVGGVGPARYQPLPGQPVFALGVTALTSRHEVAHERVHIADHLKDVPEFAFTMRYVPNARSLKDRLKNYGIRQKLEGVSEVRAVEGSNVGRPIDQYTPRDKYYLPRHITSRALGDFILTPSLGTANDLVKAWANAQISLSPVKSTLACNVALGASLGSLNILIK